MPPRSDRFDVRRRLQKIQNRVRRRRRARAARRWLWLVALLACIPLYLAYAPDNYNVARPLDLKDRPTFVTGWKLRWAGVEGCYNALDRAGIELERLPDEEKGPGCGFEDVARLDRSLITWGSGITLKCPMLAGLALWERHALRPAAEKHLGSEITRIRHYGTYSCRNVNNARRGRRSEHATANAVDIAGFVLADGREISVLADWGKRTPEGRFLKRVRDRACKHFNTVLGPEYNELHKDHFHFDNGRAEICS